MATEDKSAAKGIGGLLGNLTDFIQKLEELAEKGSELKRNGELPSLQTKEGRPPVKGVYGFSVKLGAGGPGEKEGGYKVEPFGNMRRDQTSGSPVMEEVREPLVDIFDEDDRLLIVAEMPGVEPDDIKVDVKDQTLTLSAERGQHKYRKSIEVPEGTKREELSVSCRNGIIEVSCAKGSSKRETSGGGHARAER